MIAKNFYLVIAILFTTQLVYGQSNNLSCKQYKFERAIGVDQNKKATLSKMVNVDTNWIEVGVLFHILYRDSSDFVGHDQIIRIIDSVNFYLNNLIVPKKALVFESDIGVMKVSLKLAEEYPPSINYRNTEEKSFYPGDNFEFYNRIQQFETGGLNAVAPNKLINIWVGNLRKVGHPIVLGYAFPPQGAKNWNSGSNTLPQFDGIVLDHSVFDFKQNHVGLGWKTIIHEFGHYLGLRHLSGDPIGQQDGCDTDDGIYDTPNCSIIPNWCNYELNSCAGDSLPDMIQNFMNLTPCACLFTKNQVSLMRYNLLNLRNGLPQVSITLSSQDRSLIVSNPTRESLTIYNFISNSKKEFTIRLFNMSLESAYDKQLFLEPSRNDIYGLNVPSGLYYLIVWDSKGLMVKSGKVLVL